MCRGKRWESTNGRRAFQGNLKRFRYLRRFRGLPWKRSIPWQKSIPWKRNLPWKKSIPWKKGFSGKADSPGKGCFPEGSGFPGGKPRRSQSLCPMSSRRKPHTTRLNMTPAPCPGWGSLSCGPTGARNRRGKRFPRERGKRPGSRIPCGSALTGCGTSPGRAGDWSLAIPGSMTRGSSRRTPGSFTGRACS